MHNGGKSYTLQRCQGSQTYYRRGLRGHARSSKSVDQVQMTKTTCTQILTSEESVNHICNCLPFITELREATDNTAVTLGGWEAESLTEWLGC